jgi:uncharacterized protein (DUF1330 family)
MILKLTQDLSRGFAPWKEMYFENIARLEAIGGKLIFAGSEANDDNKMMVIMEFDSKEALQLLEEMKNLKRKEQLRVHY